MSMVTNTSPGHTKLKKNEMREGKCKQINWRKLRFLIHGCVTSDIWISGISPKIRKPLTYNFWKYHNGEKTNDKKR